MYAGQTGGLYDGGAPVYRTIQRPEPFQTVEPNGTLYTLACRKCNALETGAVYDAKISGTVMLIKPQGKRQIRYTIVEAHPVKSPAEE